MSGSRCESFEVVVVGAGFAGMLMLHTLRGQGRSVRVLEAGGDVGGTWYWNRYPGARCDIESMEYSYEFSQALQQQWNWTERYAAQPEILSYANHVADRFELRRDIDFETQVVSASFDEAAHQWCIITQDDRVYRARYCVMATGVLSSPFIPDIPGLDTFAGELWHTARWPHHDVDLSNRRVGVIGTGSSGIQAIPLIAEQADQLYVFQRTANYSIPARNAPLDEAFRNEIKADYTGFRERNRTQSPGFGSLIPKGDGLTLEASDAERQSEFAWRWQRGGFGFLAGYSDLLTSKAANDKAADFVRERIHEIVADPAVADLLSPHQVIGCKRICLDTGYYETFNRDNVELVDVRSTPIECINRAGIVVDGRQFDCDNIVLATGFDAMTGALTRIDIRGSSDVALRDKWRDGPQNYLGLTVNGFPNLFMICGPGSPSVLTNMLVSIDQHVSWIAACIAYLGDAGFERIEARPEAERNWVEHVNEVARPTLYPSCNSWYLGANVPGKARVFMPHIGFPPYARRCAEVASNGYEGFSLA